MTRSIYSFSASYPNARHSPLVCSKRLVGVFTETRSAFPLFQNVFKEMSSGSLLNAVVVEKAYPDNVVPKSIATISCSMSQSENKFKNNQCRKSKLCNEITNIIMCFSFPMIL